MLLTETEVSSASGVVADPAMFQVTYGLLLPGVTRLIRLQSSQIALLGPFLFQGPVAALALRIA